MSPRFRFWFVIALAVILRVAWVLLVPSKPVGDFAMYLESAAHLLEHRALDPEFVYMPGYVAFAAGMLALGVGALGIKLVVAVAAGLCAGAIHAIAAALWDQRAGGWAALAYALWPAGIAVGSVTGTDLPAALLLVTAVFVLVHFAPTHPWRAAFGFGLVMGLSAWVRAVMLPLAAFSFFYYWSARAGSGRVRRFFRAFAPALLATAIAFATLAPWAFRNHRRYGQWFVTDSHGGLTALVGANPNADGRYSRSLNRMFKEITGYTLLAEPHRAADRASYLLAKDWIRFSPLYALGLGAAKAERLLRDERALLYWPIYRAGVLQPGIVKGWFDRHRRVIERVVDGYWWALAAAFFAGLGLAVARRRWDAVWFLPMALVLIAIYAGFFAEVRYHLPIAILMFPVAGGALVFLQEAIGHVRRLRKVPRGLWRETRYAVLAVALGGGALPGLAHAGTRLRERHRFAVHVCEIDGKSVACLWRGQGERSGVRGVWNGVGLFIGAGGTVATADLSLPPGRYWLRAEWDLGPPGDPALAAQADALTKAEVTLRAGDVVVARAPLYALAAAAADGASVPIEAEVTVGAGGLPLRLAAEIEDLVGLPAATAVWLSRLTLSPKSDLAP